MRLGKWGYIILYADMLYNCIYIQVDNILIYNKDFLGV